jgi:hypothetical protein
MNIVVGEYDDVTVELPEGAVYGSGFPGPWIADDTEARVVPAELGQDACGRISRPVVNHHHLD